MVSGKEMMMEMMTMVRRMMMVIVCCGRWWLCCGIGGACDDVDGNDNDWLTYDDANDDQLDLDNDNYEYGDDDVADDVMDNSMIRMKICQW